MEDNPRTWRGIIRRFHRRSGLFESRIRKWIRSFFKENEEKREEVKRRYFSGVVSNTEFQDLLSSAYRYIPAEELEDIREKNVRGILTEEEVNYLLNCAIPDAFLLRNVMDDLGLDYNDRNTYTKAVMFFMKERKVTQYGLDVFWQSEEYQRYIHEGHTNEELWHKFMKAAFSWDIYPLWSDPSDEHRYKLLGLYDYISLLSKRRKAIQSEVSSRAEEIKAIEPKISILSLLKPLDGQTQELRPYETLKLMPARHECPLCHNVYISAEKLAEHLERDHGAR